MKYSDKAAPGVRVHVMLERIAAELTRLSGVSDRLQHTTFEVAAAAGAEHLETFQELDRLHQSLTQLASFVSGLAAAVPVDYEVDAVAHAGNINVTRLLNAVLGIAQEETDPAEDFELFDSHEPVAPVRGEPSARSN